MLAAPAGGLPLAGAAAVTGAPGLAVALALGAPLADAPGLAVPLADAPRPAVPLAGVRAPALAPAAWLPGQELPPAVSRKLPPAIPIGTIA
ncbi:MAG: PPE family protein, partial [Gemmatimonadota bacterium]